MGAVPIQVFKALGSFSGSSIRVVRRVEEIAVSGGGLDVERVWPDAHAALAVTAATAGPVKVLMSTM